MDKSKYRKYLWLAGLLAVLTFGGSPLAVSARSHAATNTNQGGRDARTEALQNRIKNFGERLERRLTAALTRADNLRARVADRVSRFPNPKFDRTLVEQKLAEAAEAIAAGRAKVATLKSETDKALAAADQTAGLAELRQTARGIIESVRLAHQKVVEAIRLIRSAYPATATTTSSQ